LYFFSREAHALNPPSVTRAFFAMDQEPPAQLPIIEEKSKNSSSEAFIKTGSLITSVCSLSIAAASLYYTLSAQSFDRDQRELLIRPKLSFLMYPDDLKINVRNVGLGPAIITRFAFNSKNYQLDTEKDDPKFGEILIGLFKGLDVIDDDTSDLSKVRDLFGMNYRAKDDIIDKGENLDITWINQERYKEIQKENGIWEKKIVDLVKKGIQRFWTSDVTAGLRICYCSMTYKFCSFADLNFQLPDISCRNDDLQVKR
jgi:hypothetical protein